MNKEMIDEMYKETTIRKSNSGLRRYYKGKYWARVYWDLCNPESPCKNYDIHHKNENPLDDYIENLERLTRGDHMRLHNIGKHHTESTKQKMSENHMGMLGKNHTENTKKKQSLAHIGKKFSEDYKKNMSGANHPFFGKFGINSSHKRSVSINGKLFPTRKEAAEYLKVSSPTIRNRILSNNFSGYYYAK